MKKTDTFLIKAIKKMFRVAGHQFSEETIEKDGWYAKFTWDREQEAKFKKWFIQNIRKSLHISKARAEYEWSYFNLNWGFKMQDKCCIKCKRCCDC